MIFNVEKGNFSYGNRKILNDISFELNAGELLAILGPNGVGKTTLIKCMLGFLKWNDGNSFLDKKPIRNYKLKDIWKNISYVPQSRNVEFSSLTGLEFVLLGRGSNIDWYSIPKKRDVEISCDVMKKLGIYHMKDRPINELSGGELQLFLIARALVSNPKIVVLDEPESNLDFRNQLIVLDVLCELVNSGIGVIFNTHYPSHALQRANKALLINRSGKSIFGNTANIVTSKNIESAFGVKAIIGDIESEHKIYQDVLPIEIIDKKKEKKKIENDMGEKNMDTRLAIISIIIENAEKAVIVNEELHKRAKYIIGRMGMPYPKRNVQIITIVIDGPQDEISSLSGRLGQIKEVSIKTTYSKV